MVMDTKSALTLILLRKTMNRKSFLFSMLGILVFPQPKLDMKDKHNFNIYLHEHTHKLNQVYASAFLKRIQ